MTQNYLKNGNLPLGGVTLQLLKIPEYINIYFNFNNFKIGSLHLGQETFLQTH